jgi:peptidase E
MKSGKIIAIGSGEAIIGNEDNTIHDFILSTVKSDCPKIGFLPTASGDHPRTIESFQRSYQNRNCHPSVLKLFYRELIELETWFEEQEIIMVGGGNTANMLAVWRLHGVDKLLEKAWRDGKTLAGGSAGAICWFSGGITDSFSNHKLNPLKDGLRFLDYSICPHYNSASGLRQPAYEKALLSKQLSSGFAIDDYAAAVFQDQDLVETISCAPDNKVRFIELKNDSINDTVLSIP